jgi:hypothetical protein
MAGLGLVEVGLGCPHSLSDKARDAALVVRKPRGVIGGIIGSV